MSMASSVAAAVQTSVALIHRINHYPAAKYWGNQLHYPLDKDLSGGQRYPAFEQPRPENGCGNSLFACSRISTPARIQIFHYASPGSSPFELSSLSFSTDMAAGPKYRFSVYLTIIPRGRVGYEMIDSQRGA